MPYAEAHRIEQSDQRQEASAIHGAFVAAIESYPGGFDAVAKLLKMTTKRLQQEISSMVTPGTHKASPKLGANTAVEILKITGSVGPLEAMMGPGFAFVKLPPPSIESDDPVGLLRAGLRRFGMLSILWNSFQDVEQLPTYAQVLARLADFVNVLADLATKREVSPNENKALERASMNLVCAVQSMAGQAVVSALLPQMVADFAAARNLIGGRVPAGVRKD